MAPDGNPLDYYGFTNVTRAVSFAEEDPFSEYDVEKFLDNNIEARNYWVNSEDEMSKEGDVSADAATKLKNLTLFRLFFELSTKKVTKWHGYNFDDVSKNGSSRPS